MNTSELNNFIVILIYGSLVLLSLLEFTNPLKVNKKANVWFGIFLFLWSTFWIDEILLVVAGSELVVYSRFMIQFIQFFTPIAFYFSVLFFTNPGFSFKFSDVKYAVLPLIFFVNQVLYYWGGFDNSQIFVFIFLALILSQALFYTGLSFITIRRHQKKIQLFSSNTEEINLNWLEYIIVVIFGINILFIIYHIFYDANSLNFVMNISFLLVIYFVACYCLRQKEIYPLEEKQREELISINDISEIEEGKRKLISDEDLLKIKKELVELMQTQKPYLESELNLIRLSDMLSVSTHHLSYVINTGFQKNFFQYVNEYRIQYAKQLLIDEANKLSILGIAYESGFNSKTSFNTTFKKLTNQTPSQFKKISSHL